MGVFHSKGFHLASVYFIIKGDIISLEAAMAVRSFGFALHLMLLLVYVTPGICQSGEPGGADWFKTVGKLLQDLEENTPSKGFDYKTSSVGIKGSLTAYGHATCRPGVDSCGKCLAILSARMLFVGGDAISAHVQLADCSIRLEQHPF